MAQFPARSASGLVFIFTLLFAAGSLAAQSSASQLDARVLIDVSGSMKQNDPRNLRQPALRLMVGLMPAGMDAGIWSFGQYVNQQVRQGRVDERWKGLARAEAEKIHSRGLFTNIEEVLQRASADWKSPSKTAQRHLILLTDGMVDISKDPAENAASRERIVKDILPRLKALGVRVHTIALSERADHELMRQMSAETSGWYEQVNDAEQLQRVFLRIFEKVGNPDTLPLKDNRFEVDASVQEATLLVFRSRDAATPTRILPPEGKEFGTEDAPAGVRWHADEGYDLITISEPKVGTWNVRAENDPDNRVIVVTDLKMKASELPNRVVQGEKIPITVEFLDHDTRITRQAFLDVLAVTAEQKGPDGSGDRRSVFDDGQHGDASGGDGVFGTMLLTDAAAGRNELILTAEGKTFMREKRHSFELLVPASLQIDQSERDGKPLIAIRLTPDSTVVNGQSVSVRGWLEGASGSRAELDIKPDAMGVWQAQVDPTAIQGDQQLHVILSATTALGYSIELEYAPITIKSVAPPAKPAPPPVEPQVIEEEPSAGMDEMTTNLVILGAVNAAFILLGGGWFVVARRRKKRDPIRLIEDEDEGAGKSGKGVVAEEVPDVDDLIDQSVEQTRAGEVASDLDIDDLIGQSVDQARAGEGSAAEEAPAGADIDIDDLIGQSVDEARSANAPVAEQSVTTEADPFAEVGDDPFAGLAEEMSGKTAAAGTVSAPADEVQASEGLGLEGLMDDAKEEAGDVISMDAGGLPAEEPVVRPEDATASLAAADQEALGLASDDEIDELLKEMTEAAPDETPGEEASLLDEMLQASEAENAADVNNKGGDA